MLQIKKYLRNYHVEVGTLKGLGEQMDHMWANFLGEK